MTGNKPMKRVIVGVTGGSGMIYAKHFLDALIGIAEVHLVISEGARLVASYEDVNFDRYPFIYEDNTKIDAKIASGSFQYDAMVVVPCSMKTLSAIAHGYAASLITRAADVALKERRKLILVPRETPYNRIHLTNMLAANDAGAIIMPASPPLYNHPKNIDDLADMMAARILDHCEIKHTLGTRWGDEEIHE